MLGSTGTVNVFEPNIGAIAQSYLPDYWGWIIGVGAAGVYALRNWITHARRLRAELPTEPVALLVVRTVAVAAVAVGSVAVLNSFKGVPTVGVILLGLVIGFSWLTTRTRFGAYVFAIGGNAEASRRAGIKISRIRIIVFALSGLMAAVGGLMFVSRLTAPAPRQARGRFCSRRSLLR